MSSTEDDDDIIIIRLKSNGDCYRSAVSCPVE